MKLELLNRQEHSAKAPLIKKNVKNHVFPPTLLS